MDGVLSQEEINALLNNDGTSGSGDELLTAWEQQQQHCFPL